MSIISEKVAYLKGLAEGMKIEDTTNEGKLLTAIIGVLGEVAEDLDYLEESQDELFDRVFDIEDELFDEEDDDFDIEPEEFSIECPACGEEFFISDEDLESDEEIACPNCGEVIEFDFDCDCDCDDCH